MEEKLLAWFGDSKGKGKFTFNTVILILVSWNAFTSFKQDYVSKKVYDEDRAKETATYEGNRLAQNIINAQVTDALNKINLTLTMVAAQDERARDHETRIRINEKDINTLKEKLNRSDR